MRLYTLSAAVGLTLLVIASGLLVRSRRALLHFVYSTGPLAEAQYHTLGARPGWQTKTLEVAPGVVLRGLWRAPQSAQAPVVLFFQGNSQTLLSEGQDYLEALRAESDLGLLLFAYRGYSGSGGKPSRAVLIDDAWAVYAGLTAHEGAGRALHVVGFSLGTALAAEVAARAARAGQPPATLTLLAPYTELAMMPAGFIYKLLPAERIELTAALQEVRGPVLVVHGDKDEVLPPVMSRTLLDLLGSRGRRLELPGVGHVPLLFEPRALAAVRAFQAGQN